jgi:hypothetical protein
MTQIVATVIACVVNLMTASYLIDTIPNICTEKNIEWRCPISTTFYSASIIWGAIGNRDFSQFLSLLPKAH